MGLSLVSTLRERLAKQSEEVTLHNPRLISVENKEETCVFQIPDNTTLKLPTNRSELAAITSLARSPQIGSKIIESLVILLRDSQSIVKFGALLALDSLNKVPENTVLNVDGMYISGVNLKSKVMIFVADSVLFDFDCDVCDLNVYKSVVYTDLVEDASYTESVLYDYRQATQRPRKWKE